MKIPNVVAIALLLVCAASSVRTEASEDWVKYDAEEYGFSMLVPPDTKFAEKEYADGWGELVAQHEGVTIYGLAKKGAKATPEEIEKVGVKLTGIPSDAWTQIGKGENQAGWVWYRTVKASGGGKLVIGDYGVGSKSSYLLIIVTTESDYAEYKSEYEKWYRSIQLN